MSTTFPYAEPVVVRGHELRVTRRCAAESEIKVRPRDRVTADQVIARTEPRLVALRIPIADQLDIAPGEVSRHLMRPIGSTFASGEPLARTRRGMRNVIVAAPVAGTLIDVDTVTGAALLAPTGAGEVKALIPGDVEFIEPKLGISIRTVGARVLGVVGLGEAASGPLFVAVDGPNQDLTPDRIGPSVAGAIVIGGASVSSAALKKLIEHRAAGLVSGGMVEREVATAFGWQTEDRLAPWRPLPGERVLAEGLPVPLPIVATEGFGTLPINPRAFDLLAALQGQTAVLLTATRLLGGLLRPEIIIPDRGKLDEDGATSTATLAEGVKVRLVDPANLGKTATVAGDVRRERFSDGHVGLAVEVELEGGSHRLVHTANVEVISES